MKVKVERCWSGSNYNFRIIPPDPEKKFLHEANEDWDWQKSVKRVLERLELRGYVRRNVRFVHVN